MGELDGLLTFFSSHHAMRAERVLGSSGFGVELIPGPKELSPNCGVALRFEHVRREEAETVLSDAGVPVDEVHRYQPATDGFRRRGAGARFRRLRGGESG